MRHRLSGRQLSRNAPHRHAMLRNMSVSLLRYETIRTTLPKAKDLRMVPRAGDNAPMALMQLVDKAAEVVAGEKPAAAKPARKKKVAAPAKEAAGPAAETKPRRRKKAAA
jgi:hypothetical protein